MDSAEAAECCVALLLSLLPNRESGALPTGLSAARCAADKRSAKLLLPVAACYFCRPAGLQQESAPYPETKLRVGEDSLVRECVNVDPKELCRGYGVASKWC